MAAFEFWVVFVYADFAEIGSPDVREVGLHSSGFVEQ